MNIKPSYLILVVVGLLLIAVGGTLAFTLQAPEQTETYTYTLPSDTGQTQTPSQQQPSYNPSQPYGQSDYQRQLDELRRQQEQMQYEQQRQMREYYLGLAQMYQSMADAALTEYDKLTFAGYWEEASEYWYQYKEYRRQASYYFSLAYGYTLPDTYGETDWIDRWDRMQYP